MPVSFGSDTSILPAHCSQDAEFLGFAPFDGCLPPRCSPPSASSSFAAATASPALDLQTARRARLARVAAFGLWAAHRQRWRGPPAAEWDPGSGFYTVDGVPVSSALEQEAAAALGRRWGSGAFWRCSLPLCVGSSCKLLLALLFFVSSLLRVRRGFLCVCFGSPARRVSARLAAAGPAGGA